MKKYVYLFSEGRADMRALLGGKGANLAEMHHAGLPVPAGMTISTEACRDFYAQGESFPEGLLAETDAGLVQLEKITGKRFGDPSNPLLLSVRSGSVFSMPGMMDTILNLGLNETVAEGLAKQTGNPRFAADAYRRFIQMFCDVALGVEKSKFEALIDKAKHAHGAKSDQDLTLEALHDLIKAFKDLCLKEYGAPFPDDPREQLRLAIAAVLRSWNNHRAVVYRTINQIDHSLGTAVNIQSMVFGNMGEDCCTGVAFTRNPSTGENTLYGEYLINAQGEDVVAGIRTPQPIAGLKKDMSAIYDQFHAIARQLESHFGTMQDIEFTVEKGVLHILQTRNGKRTARAALKIAVDMVNEGLVSREEALLMVEPAHLAHMLHRQIEEHLDTAPIAKGLPASPGAAVGKVVFTADEAEALGKNGEKVILVRVETTPDDIHGIVQAQGILTSRGGMTSHAAVVARGMGRPCVCGCESIKVDYAANLFTVGNVQVRSHDVITIDGSTGRVFVGTMPLRDPEMPPEYHTLLQWADDAKRLEVRANADTAEDARRAREHGATGIGLVRTEHMFMAADRLPYVQRMILADNEEERKQALEDLLPVQENDFYGILSVMRDCPVCIRLLDPPLHEFLPNHETVAEELAALRRQGAPAAQVEAKERILKKIIKLHENNPMLGHRGCRLGITYPEVYEMQMRAIFRASARLTAEGVTIIPEVEIPLTMCLAEMDFFKPRIDRIAAEVMNQFGVRFHYLSGSMIELPRAALLADELAESAEFFSFGTNDLTQTSFGFSRDDAEGKFMEDYLEKKILPVDPFIVLDRKGVGALMRIAVEKGRGKRPGMIIGICGEHGGEPSSVAFCHDLGLTYVSCSPFRVPIARLAAAQAAIGSGKPCDK